VINTDDVMLLTRRNEGLESVLRDALDRMRARERPTEGAKAGRATKATAKSTVKGKARA
jgi:hypothetical protein